jgi:DNA-binding NtrC family response regulator
MTAYSTPEVAQEALDLGAVRVVNKPFGITEIATLVTQVCESSPEGRST